MDRSTLRAWRQASRWLLVCPLVVATVAGAAALGDRPKPAIVLARSTESARLDIEIRMLGEELELLQREIDRLEIHDRQPGRPATPPFLLGPST